MRRIALLVASMAVAVLVVGGVGLLVPGEPAQAAFPGVNSRIAFESQRWLGPCCGSEDSEVYTMEGGDGSGLRQLTDNPRIEDRNPAWSPDGTKLAFTRAGGRVGGWDSEIYAMNYNGSGKTRLTDNSHNDMYPTWSADGAKIAFVGSGGEIWVMNADGTSPTNLTNDPASDTMPAWSPDGTRIAFVRVDPEGEWEIFVMNADGSGQEQLTYSPRFCYNYDPDWSPNGSKIAFTFQCNGDMNVWTMNADGTGAEQLGTGGTHSPAWSPDGKKIAFVKAQDGHYDIFKMNADGTNQKNLTNSLLVDDDNPSWGPTRPAASSG